MLGPVARAILDDAERVKREQQRCVVALTREAAELRARTAALEKECEALSRFCEAHRAEARDAARRAHASDRALHDEIAALQAKLDAATARAPPCRCELMTVVDPHTFDARRCTARQVERAVTMVRELRYRKLHAEAEELVRLFGARGLAIGEGTKRTRWRVRGGGEGWAEGPLN